MHITPVHCSYYKNIPNFKNKQKNQSVNVQNNFDPICCNALKSNIIFTANKRHKYSPVASIEPNYKPIGNYENIDEFSVKFAKKINSQLMNPTMKDLDELIDAIKYKTNASNSLILETLFRLTQFSSYSSLSEIEKTIHNDKTVILPYKHQSYSMNLNINDALFYICRLKFDFSRVEKLSELNYCLFIDSLLLNNLEKNNKMDNYQNLEKYKKIYILDGCNIKTKNGNYLDSSFLTGDGHLKELAIEVIRKVQQGKSLDEALNGNIEKRFLKLYPEKSNDIKVIKRKIPKINLKKEILNNLQQTTVTPKEIKSCIENTGDNIKKIFKKIENPYAIVAEYLDNSSMIFSPTSIGMQLYKKGKYFKHLEEATKRKNLYFIPDNTKSCVLISYMYAKINGISPEQIQKSTLPYGTKDRNIIILDDVSISGDSFDDLEDMAENEKYKNFKNCQYYFAPIASCGNEEYFKRLFTIVPGMKLYSLKNATKGDSYEYQYLNYNKKEYTPREKIIIISHMCKAFSNDYTGVALPYMLPDNNSHIASELFKNLLYRITDSSAKFFDYI